MAIAVDSSVLLAIFKDEPNGAAWLRRLAEFGRDDVLIACDVAWAEVAPAFSSLQSLQSAMLNLGVLFSAIDQQVAYRAGHLFVTYRRDGGPRQRVLPDFMIAAHALLNARGLATADEGYQRSCFTGLRIYELNTTSQN